MTEPLPIRPTFRVAMETINHAAELFGIDPASMITWDRRRPVVRARWAVMWVLRQVGHSYPRIAKHVGQRDHTTIIYGVRSAEKLRESDPVFACLTTLMLIEAELGRAISSEAA